MMPEYYLADPTGNITILVSSDVPSDRRAEVAARLMEREPSAEQAGFLSEGDADADLTLNMAGGEFCANATLSAAAALCVKQGRSGGTFRIRVSGMDEPVKAVITGEENRLFGGSVFLPPPEKISDESLELGGKAETFPVVFFKGITHVIAEKRIPTDEAERAAKKWCDDLQADALGIMQLSEDGSLVPLVYVKKANTLFWESSCASGTAAAGAYLRKISGEKLCERTFTEPAGRLSVEAGEEYLKLTGTVRILKTPRSAD